MDIKHESKRAARIALEDISKVAAQGVTRALEARLERVDLTEDEINHISGGSQTDADTTIGYYPDNPSPEEPFPDQSGS